MNQKTITIIRHDKQSLPILEHMSKAEFVSLAISGGLILWNYKGLALLIPSTSIMNMARLVEALNKRDSVVNKAPKFVFTSADAIVLPEKIKEAMLHTP